MRGEWRSRTAGRRLDPRRIPSGTHPARGVIEGRITIVQEDRIRLVDGTGRGYLFVVKKRRASLAELERWRDARAGVRVRYVGQPDAGALALRIEVAGVAPSSGGGQARPASTGQT